MVNKFYIPAEVIFFLREHNQEFAKTISWTSTSTIMYHSKSAAKNIHVNNTKAFEHKSPELVEFLLGLNVWSRVYLLNELFVFLSTSIIEMKKNYNLL